ncbi:ABC transporter ATP-binding protein [Carnobacterium divergens]|nr:ABC transporter ATP-binding protein [Carnobacterium divergens]
MVGLVGPNGAGKTTLMKLMVGLSSSSTGSIRLNDFDIKKNFLDFISQVGAIIEVPIFYPSMTGFQCLSYYGKLRNINKNKILQAVKLVGLENNIQSKVRTYSLGMRQRLGIAQAIMNQPQLLILDEPFNGLDPQGVDELKDILLTTKNAGSTVFISSHTLSELEIICDRIIFMNHGEIIKDDYLHSQTRCGLKMCLITSDNLTAKNLIEKNNPTIRLKRNNQQLILEHLVVSQFTDILILLKNHNIEIISMEEAKESLQKTFHSIITKESEK